MDWTHIAGRSGAVAALTSVPDEAGLNREDRA